MGILNVTPDSFYDGGQHPGPAAALAHGRRLAAEGADLIDVGGESSRPGAAPITSEEEGARVVPVVEALRRACDVPISVDTTKADVADAALAAGADVVNDISAGRFDARMLPLVAARGATIVLMHMRGTPATMQTAPRYDDVLGEVEAFLAERVRVAVAAGIHRDRIWIDPGIGFGKRREHNLLLLAQLGRLRDLGFPVVIGASRKRFLAAADEDDPADRLAASLAAATLASAAGAAVVRVHDVAATRRAVAVADALKRPGEHGD
ncbi:MAG: dihydropteroate synthase [Deltaproteobacteria bacterium]|nr:dihydropteroate synthase [Deltaproteobacteria bacterium]